MRRRMAVYALALLLVAGTTSLPNAGRLLAATSPTAPLDEAVGYRMDPARSGSQAGDPAAPPLSRVWVHDYGTNNVIAGYPIIAGGRIFELAWTQPNFTPAGTHLFAFDAPTGTALWNAHVNDYWDGIAYDGGQLFVAEASGVVVSLDPATGSVLWSVTAGTALARVDPIAANGLVYLVADRLLAIRQSDGTTAWSAPISGALALKGSTDLFVNAGLARIYDLDPLTGAQIWARTPSAGAEAPSAITYYDGRVYTYGQGGYDLVRDAATGTPVGAFTADSAAFYGGFGFFLANTDGNPNDPSSNAELRAVDLASGTVAWRFKGDRMLSSAPTVVAGYVFTGSQAGKLYALDPSTGGLVWTTDTGASLAPGDPGNSGALEISIAAGEGLVAVPSGKTLQVYRGAGAPAPPPQALVAPTSTPIPPAADAATQYLLHATHDSAQTADNLGPNLAQSWSVDLGGLVNYPLIVAGKVFATVDEPGGDGELYALARSTGAVIWGPIDLSGGQPGVLGMAYDNGKIFVLSRGNLLRALDAQTGATLWLSDLSPLKADLTIFAEPPVAAGGLVFAGVCSAQLARAGGLMIAVSENDGSFVWSTPWGPDGGGVAADGGVVFQAGNGPQASARDAGTGTQRWHYGNGSSGRCGYTPALVDGRLYVRADSPQPTGVIIDAGSGAVAGAFSSDSPPAIDGGRMYVLDTPQTSPTLKAVDIASETVLWSFAGDGQLTSVPLLDGVSVYVGSKSGNVYQLDRGTGAVTWSGSTGSAIQPSWADDNISRGPALGLGVLAVPSGTSLVVFGPDTTQTTHLSVAPASTTAVGGQPIGIIVTAQTAGGTRDSTNSHWIGFSSSDSRASLPAPVRLVNGTATVQATFNTAGAQTVTATDLGNSAIRGTSPPITVAAAPTPPPSPSPSPSSPPVSPPASPDPTPTPTATVPSGPGEYRPLDPSRILDTRFGVGAGAAPVAADAALEVQVTGRGGVPTQGVAAVVLNVTVTNTSANGFLTVWPTGRNRPVTSNLNWPAARTVPNLVEVGVGTGGKVSLYNATGSADVIFDVEGYVATADASQGAGLYTPIAPNRVVDTRFGTGAPKNKVGAAQSILVRVTGTAGVASSGVGAVVLNVTATNPTSAGFVTVFPGGGSPPNSSNLNFAAGQTVPNRVMVKLGRNPADGSTGWVSLYNASGAVDLIVDVVGWFTDGSNPTLTASRFSSVVPARIVDSRFGTGGFNAPLGPGQVLSVPIAGRGGVPAMTSSSPPTAVVVNLTATRTTAPSYLTAWASQTAQPNASDLNWVAGQTVPNLVVVALGGDGKIELYNSVGSADFIIDVFGWYG